MKGLCLNVSIYLLKKSLSLSLSLEREICLLVNNVNMNNAS